MKIEIYWPEILRVSHSRLKCWRRCQMQHHYKYYQRISRVRRTVPLMVGSAVHSFIEAFHQSGDWGKELNEFKGNFKKLFKEEQVELGDLPTRVDQIVEGYFNWWSDDGLIYNKRRRGKATEIELRVDLDSRTQFLGYIDAYPQDNDGRNWLMDHKTCKNIPDEDTRFSDLQMLYYVWLLPQLGYPKPDGIIWDYIRTKPPTKPEILKNGSISKNKNIDTTYSVYMGTVIEELGLEKAHEYEEFAESLKGREDRFYRRIFLPNPSPSLVSNIVNDVRSSIAEIRHLGPKAKTRNMSRDCKMCQYYILCQSEVRGLDSEYIRKTEFKVEEDRYDKEEIRPNTDISESEEE